MAYNNETLLVGTGYMAREYIKVLEALNINTVVVGNRKESVESFRSETNKEAIYGGIELYLKKTINNNILPNAIVAVNIEKGYNVAKCLIERGVKRILLEKPGVLNYNQLDDLIHLSEANDADVFVAYNRRFFSSIEHAQQIIKADGGIKSGFFEFTEWISLVESGTYTDEVKKKWVLCNSSHVLDVFFSLCGVPDDFSTTCSGKISWHDCGAVYCGSGVTQNDVLFSYHSNWKGPGRWGIELVTDKHRLYLRPMESLSIQELNSVDIKAFPLKNNYDSEFKPGVYEETRAFMRMSDKEDTLCTLYQQRELMRICETISGEDYNL